VNWPFSNLLNRWLRRGNHFEGILELFDDHVHVGERTADGRYLPRFSGPTLERFVGAGPRGEIESNELWDSCVDPLDRASYDRFWAELVTGRAAQVTYRLIGLDGVKRTVWHRARSTALKNGGLLVQGLVSDVTKHEETAARLAEADDRFMHLLDVIGEHVYRAIAHPDGRIEELYQGPGADRLLGGADPDGAMENWTAAIHPEDVAAVAAFDAALVQGQDANVEYRLRGFDGVTRWVHDRATAHRRDDGTVEVSGIVSDVTERRRLHTELASAHSALARVVEAMDDHLYTLGPDAGGHYRSLYRGPNLERLTGRTLALGEVDSVWASMVHPHDRSGRHAALAKLDRGEPIELEYRVTGRDGNERIVLDRLRPRRAADGTLLYDGVTRDITERRKLENELRRAHHAAEQLATTDELTGAYNRRHFTAIAAEALAGDAPSPGLLLLDADHFKRINDVHGHVTGDAVLVELVRRLRTALGPDDVLARWGGEEFAVLVRGIVSDDQLARRAEELLDAVAATPVTVRDLRLRLTVSIGGVRAGASLDTLDALIEHADRHLYTAKRDGRNRVSLPQETPFITRISPGADAPAQSRRGGTGKAI
jgi:diguanylate cyclase (GGDEF)-like protein/PAS domain S-box-containing protein